MNDKSPETMDAETAPTDGDAADATLSPIRERFCRYYLTEPSATRAAVKAGYSERTAPQQASRLLSSVNILQRIDAIRRTEHLVYELSPQAVMDRCEAIFEEALEKGRFEAAIGALRLQAKIGGLLRPDHLPATKQDLAGAIDYGVRAAVSKYVAFGTLGASNPLAPPPWPPGEEAARRTRRKVDRELAGSAPGKHSPAADATHSAEGRLEWPGDEASLMRSAVGHEDEFQRAAGLPPLTPVLPKWRPTTFTPRPSVPMRSGGQRSRAPSSADFRPRRTSVTQRDLRNVRRAGNDRKCTEKSGKAGVFHKWTPRRGIGRYEHKDIFMLAYSFRLGYRPPNFAGRRRRAHPVAIIFSPGAAA
jgi:hypothetical protein